MLSPICPQHAKSEVHLQKSGQSDLVVTCSAEPTHVLNMCSRQDFEAEKEEARKLLAKL